MRFPIELLSRVGTAIFQRKINTSGPLARRSDAEGLQLLSDYFFVIFAPPQHGTAFLRGMISIILCAINKNQGRLESTASLLFWAPGNGLTFPLTLACRIVGQLNKHMDKRGTGSHGATPARPAEGREGALLGAGQTVASGSSGYYPAIQDPRMTFVLFVETKFIPEHVEHKTLSGQTHYQAILKHLLKPETVNRIFNPNGIANARLKSVPGWPYLDDIRLCDITVDHVRNLISAAFARNYSPQTVKHIKNVAFAIISHAQRESCFQGPNPVSQVNLPPMTRKTEQNLTTGQTRAVLELMSYPEREIALITITTGMNIHEICHLQWKHVNLDRSPRQADGDLIPAMSIAVRTQWNRIGLGDSKRGRKRNIGIPKPLVSILENLKQRKPNPLPDDYVLESHSGQPISVGDLRTGRLKPIGRKVGAPWLSWRVLGRAHVAALSEFRSQLTAGFDFLDLQNQNVTDKPAVDEGSEEIKYNDAQASLP